MAALSISRQQAFVNALTTPLALRCVPGDLIDSHTLEDGRIFGVFCENFPGHHERWTAQRLIHRLQSVQKRDRRDPYTCTLTGFELKQEKFCTHTELDEIDKVAILFYRLVLVELDTEVPKGYVTFRLRIEEQGDEAGCKVEIGEVWIEPSLRGMGLGRLLAQSMVALVGEASIELDERLKISGVVSRQKPLELQTLFKGDVCSPAGEMFVRAASDLFSSFALQMKHLTDNPLPHLRFRVGVPAFEM